MSDASARGGEDAGLTRATVVQASREQATASLPGESIILGMRDGVYFGVSDVAARIWALLATPVTLGEIHAIVIREFEVAPDVAWRDLVDFVGALRAAGLLQIRQDP